MRFKAQLFEVAAQDGGVGDVVDERVDSLASIEMPYVWETARRCSGESPLYRLGSGVGLLTGPSQQVATFCLQSRQIVLPPTRKSETRWG
jgi:hypothetical protein